MAGPENQKKMKNFHDYTKIEIIGEYALKTYRTKVCYNVLNIFSYKLVILLMYPATFVLINNKKLIRIDVTEKVNINSSR